jgi:protein subunit release factor A
VGCSRNVLVEITAGSGIDISYLEAFARDLELRHYHTSGKPRILAMEAFHKPSGIKAVCSSEKNQRLNTERVLQVLSTKLYSIELQRQQEYLTRIPQDLVYLDTDLLPLMTNDSRKIRTYSYLHDRVIDRRLAGRFELSKVHNGELDDIIQECLDRDIQERLLRSIDGES